MVVYKFKQTTFKYVDMSDFEDDAYFNAIGAERGRSTTRRQRDISPQDKRATKRRSTGPMRKERQSRVSVPAPEPEPALPTFKRKRAFSASPPKTATAVDEKKVRYAIAKHIDHNRDLYFIKLVAGALKRKNFHSLINVESEVDMTESGERKIDGIDVKIKYSYDVQLLHAWASAMEKVKDMISTREIHLDSGWKETETLHRRIIQHDTLIISFSRYVAFVIMTESNDLVPRNRTRYMIRDSGRMADERILDLMRAVNKDLKVLKPELVNAYL